MADEPNAPNDVYVEADTGSVIIDQGRVGQECYIIESGYAGVYVADEHIVTLGPGSMVGEMALIDRRPRTATVVAESPIRLLEFDTKAFRQLLAEMHYQRVGAGFCQVGGGKLVV